MRAPERQESKDHKTVTWKVRYRIPHPEKPGQKMERSETFPKQSDAETFAALMGDGAPGRVAEALAWLDRKRGGDVAMSLTFGHWFDTYLNQLTGVTSRTRDDYRSLHRRYLTTLDHLPVEHIARGNVAHLVNRMEQRGLSPKTIKNVMHMLSSCLALAVDEGHLARNPTKRVRLPKQRHDGDESDLFLTYEEFGQLHDSISAHYQPLVAFLVGTGLRWSEATALQNRHVNLAAGTVAVRQAWKKIEGGWELGPPKTPKARRTVNAGTLALVALAPLVGKPDDFVFKARQGGVVRHGNFYSRIWAPAVTRSGLLPRPKIKDLRHTHASWLISNGVSLEAVQDQLGHESILTTRGVYGHLLPAVGVEVGRVASAAMERALAGRPKTLELEGS